MFRSREHFWAARTRPAPCVAAACGTARSSPRAGGGCCPRVCEEAPELVLQLHKACSFPKALLSRVTSQPRCLPQAAQHRGRLRR